MLYTAIEEKLKNLPDEYIPEVMGYLSSLESEAMHQIESEIETKFELKLKIMEKQKSLSERFEASLAG